MGRRTARGRGPFLDRTLSSPCWTVPTPKSGDPRASTSTRAVPRPRAEQPIRTVPNPVGLDAQERGAEGGTTVHRTFFLLAPRLGSGCASAGGTSVPRGAPSRGGSRTTSVIATGLTFRPSLRDLTGPSPRGDRATSVATAEPGQRPSPSPPFTWGPTAWQRGRPRALLDSGRRQTHPQDLTRPLSQPPAEGPRTTFGAREARGRFCDPGRHGVSPPTAASPHGPKQDREVCCLLAARSHGDMMIL